MEQLCHSTIVVDQICGWKVDATISGEIIRTL